MINAEMITAFSVFLGALFGGVVAVVAELKKPERRDVDGSGPPGKAAGDDDPAEALATLVREESEHTNRTIWIVEKKLTDHLHRIELAIAAARGDG